MSLLQKGTITHAGNTCLPNLGPTCHCSEECIWSDRFTVLRLPSWEYNARTGSIALSERKGELNSNSGLRTDNLVPIEVNMLGADSISKNKG